MTLLTVDVIIVNYNTEADLGACLASLHEHRSPHVSTIVVVDNASTDGSVRHARARWSRVHVIALESNVGFAAANNVAIRRSTADLVLLLNSDATVTRNAIDTLVACLKETGAVAAGPRLVDANGRPEVSFGPMLSPLAELRQRGRVRRARSKGPIAQWRTARLLRKERRVDWVSGACLLVRRQAALDAGLLDERYFLYEEDVDFCAALRAAGGRILYTPLAEVIHLRGRSRAHAPLQGTGHYDRSHLAFYEKHLPRWAPVLRLWLRLKGRRLR